MAFTEDLYIYKDTLLLCKILLKYSNSVSRTVRFTTYNEAVVKSCTALDLVRRINESWENREERMHDYILLMSEVKSRISLLTDAEFLNKKQATNLGMMTDKVLKEAYACRKGKGTGYGIADVKKQIKRVSDNYTKEAWILKGDLQGFFMSINRLLLYDLLEKAIRKKYHGSDIEWWLWLWKKVVLHDPTKNCVRVGDLSLWDKLPANKSLFTCGEGKGLPIGNLPSQLLANLLLSRFDKLMIERVGEDGGYGRYVDDFVVIGRDKKLLLNILQEARNYLLEELGLTLHPHKVSLQRAASGVRFTGVLIRPGRTLPNQRTIEHLYDVIDRFGMAPNPEGEVLQRYANRINSLMGMLAHCNTYNIRRKAWTMMPHKDRVFCINMKKIRIMNKYKM